MYGNGYLHERGDAYPMTMEAQMLMQARKDDVMGAFFKQLHAHGICQLCGEMVAHKEHHLRTYHKITEKGIHRFHMTMPHTGVFKV